MTYLDAHYARLRLADDLSTSRYQQYISAFVESHSTFHPQGSYDGFVEELTGVLEQAETFTLSPNMFSLVQATAEDMPPEPLRPEDVPSKCGFLWLAEPIAELDIRGRLLRHHAVLWAERPGEGIHVWWFADRNDNMDEVNRGLRATGQDLYTLMQVGRFMLAESTSLHFDSDLPRSPDTTGLRRLNDYGVLPDLWELDYEINLESITEEDGSVHVRYVPVRKEDATLTDEQFALIEDAYADLGGTEQTNTGLKQLVCFWRLCQQTLSAKEYVPPDRALRKQMIRRKLVPKAVTVIILRRRRSNSDGHSEIEWDHRWVRRGHWRQQWFGSHRDEAERYQRAIYINPTICGPEDKPLIIRPHVNVLKR